MTAAYLLLAALLFRSCLGAENEKAGSPTFTPDSIVNSADGRSESLTPNGLATIYGSYLAEGTASVPEVGTAELPTMLGNVRVAIGGVFVSLFYVSPGKINFLIPSELLPGDVDLLLNNRGQILTVRIKLLDAAPALFSTEGWITAAHADGSLISPDAPGRPGETVMIYGAGLGPTDPPQVDGMIPRASAPILLLDRLRVLLDGESLPNENILYAGIT